MGSVRSSGGGRMLAVQHIIPFGPRVDVLVLFSTGVSIVARLSLVSRQGRHGKR